MIFRITTSTFNHDFPCGMSKEEQYVCITILHPEHACPYRFNCQIGELLIY